MTDRDSPKRARVAVTVEATPGVETPELAAEENNVSTEADAEADALLEQELRNAQAELDKETEEMLEKMRVLEREFNARKAPLYKTRGDVIKQIPGFWLHCFMQHRDIKLVLGAVDQDILSNLTELEVEPFDDIQSGYELVLHFSENDFFEDKILTKQIRFQQETGQLLQCTVTGCQPKWKGEDLTQPETVKVGRKRGRDSVAFFRWFTQANAFEPGLIDTLADIIKDQLWINPLEFMDADDAEEPIILDDEEADAEEVWDLEDEEDEEDEEESGDLPEGGEEVELEEYEDEEEGLEGDAGGGAPVEEGDQDLIGSGDVVGSGDLVGAGDLVGSVEENPDSAAGEANPGAATQ